jgi:amidohydrolase
MEIDIRIKELSEKYYDEIVSVRRYLHANPELSFEEFGTSAFICSKLDEWGVVYRKGIVKTGIVAELSGNKSGRIIAFRADMDALPIHEINNVPYKSIRDGVMHACGHDLHTASLLGAIRILQELKNEFSGKILFVFQPGEEKIPGGAKLMLEENLFGNDSPELILAQHVYPELESGKAGFREGLYMASSDEIYITVKGKGGHAALPEKLTDPVLISAHIITALQQVVSRHALPGLPTVLSFGKIEGKGAVNVIPDEVKIEGTFRTMNEEWRSVAHELIKNIVINTSRGMGGDADVEIRHGYPFLINDKNICSAAKKMASVYLGQNNVSDLDIRMTAEDFAYFSQKYPSLMYRLGIAGKNKKAPALHTSDFDVNEESIKTGMGLQAWLAVGFLKA